MGENASIDYILNKLDGFYGNVSSSETLIQSFYSDYQKDSETIVAHGSRLEQTLSRAIRYGHIDLVAKDAMLRSKFWTGLKSAQLKHSTRHLYDSIKDFSFYLKKFEKSNKKRIVIVDHLLLLQNKKLLSSRLVKLLVKLIIQIVNYYSK